MIWVHHTQTDCSHDIFFNTNHFFVILMSRCCLLCVLISTINICHIICSHLLPRSKGFNNVCNLTVEKFVWCAMGLSEKVSWKESLPFQSLCKE